MINLTITQDVCADITITINGQTVPSGPVVVPPVFPPIPNENSTFNDEGDSVDGWSTAGGAVSSVGSRLRLTKTSASGSGALTEKLLSYPESDYLLYGSMRAKMGAGNAGVLWMRSGGKFAALWLGSADGGQTETPGCISIRGDVGVTMHVASAASAYDYENNDVEFLLWLDARYSTLGCYFRESDGRWQLKARVPCDHFQAVTAQILNNNNSGPGNWVEFDYLTMCRPNIVNVGDSIQEGQTGFSNDPALGLTNYNSTWMRHAPIYPTLRNNFIVNKAVAGETSAQITARVPDVAAQLPRLVFLGASNNDYINAVPQATRTANIQAAVTAIKAAGAECILMNGCGGTSGAAYNASNGLRDYMVTWWSTYRPSVTGVFRSIDTMQALGSPTGYANAANVVGDGVHPNVRGYAAIGSLLTS